MTNAMKRTLFKHIKNTLEKGGQEAPFKQMTFEFRCE